MLLRGVIGHQIHDHPDMAFFSFAYQPVEIRHFPVKGIDGGVIGNVVTEIDEWRRIHGADPDGIDAQVANIIQPRSYPVDITDAIAVGVLEAARINLIDHRVFPPRILRFMSAVPDFFGRSCSLLCGGGRGCEAQAHRPNRNKKFGAVEHVFFSSGHELLTTSLDLDAPAIVPRALVPVRHHRFGPVRGRPVPADDEEWDYWGSWPARAAERAPPAPFHPFFARSCLTEYRVQ